MSERRLKANSASSAAATVVARAANKSRLAPAVVVKERNIRTQMTAQGIEDDA